MARDHGFGNNDTVTDINDVSRIERLEALEDIRQLVARYALAADMCDLDALASLFVDDVRVGKATGRETLKASFAAILGGFDATFHHIGNHVIDLHGSDHAEGVVYCRAQHEMGGALIDAQCIYDDRYERRRGRWLFVRRRPLLWYVVPLGVNPAGPGKVRWPGTSPAEGNMHVYSPAWAAFRDQETEALAPFDPSSGFLAALRRGLSVRR